MVVSDEARARVLDQKCLYLWILEIHLQYIFVCLKSGFWRAIIGLRRHGKMECGSNFKLQREVQTPMQNMELKDAEAINRQW